MLRSLAVKKGTAASDVWTPSNIWDHPMSSLKDKFIQGWLASKWGHDRRSLSTLVETDLASCSEGGHLFSSTDSQVRAEELEHVQLALNLLATMNMKVSVNDGGQSALRQFTADMLEWILPALREDDSLSSQDPHGDLTWRLSTANVMHLGRALSKMPSGTINLAELKDLSPILASVVEVSSMGKTLPSAAEDLGWADRATLVRFYLNQFL